MQNSKHLSPLPPGILFGVLTHGSLSLNCLMCNLYAYTETVMVCLEHVTDEKAGAKSEIAKIGPMTNDRRGKSTDCLSLI